MGYHVLPLTLRFLHLHLHLLIVEILPVLVDDTTVLVG